MHGRRALERIDRMQVKAIRELIRTNRPSGCVKIAGFARWPPRPHATWREGGIEAAPPPSRKPSGRPNGLPALNDDPYRIVPIQYAAMHTTMVPTSTHVVLNLRPMIQYMKPKTMSCGKQGMIISK